MVEAFNTPPSTNPQQLKKGATPPNLNTTPERKRYLRIDTDKNAKVTETRSIGNIEKITKNGTTEIKRHLPGGVLVTVNASGDTAAERYRQREIQYLHKDHLGSLNVITDARGAIVTDGNGNKALYSFDAWGQRRNALSWKALTSAELAGFDTNITTRGYTGHEMLDQVGLIHMNGRIYDPRLARFLQADPFIDGVTNTQGYNRYSYVHNNPLSYTDPSGYGASNGVWSAVKIVVAVVATIACQGPCAPATWAWAMGTTGALQAANMGGNFGDIATAAFTNAVMAYYGASLMPGAGAGFSEWASYGMSMGVIGGATTVLSGGKFGHGFISAGAGSALGGVVLGIKSPVGRIIMRTVIGGSISEVTGGKFANGAATAAFAAIVAEGARAAQNYGERGIPKNVNESRINSSRL
ncbi:MAG: RHS repeat-associated core domain-containing protein [Gammaproteobacteria bacterium]|nr:RHS repeat-associated core domain-containing protein [Gammaproteobacteria bacterium]